MTHFYLGVMEPWGWLHGSDGLPADGWTTNGGSFTWDETNGGSGATARHCDVQYLKLLFPDDPVVDFVYRTAMANFTMIKKNSNNFIRDIWGITAFLYEAIAATDWDDLSTSQLGNENKSSLLSHPQASHTKDLGRPPQSTPRSWAAQQLALGSVPGTNLTRFFFERGLLASRSDWTTNATQLLFQPRAVKGGHTLSDHGKIALASHGRW